jgi:hypothetical protein
MGITFFFSVQLLLIYLSFLKIVHHCSSLLARNSKGTQKIKLYKLKDTLMNNTLKFYYDQLISKMILIIIRL